uniref:Uncharacterized protein n=1 Tax=Hemiselmis andersenii TaxID=464988 RepID=A0A7S0Y4Z9_HEMAN
MITRFPPGDSSSRRHSQKPLITGCKQKESYNGHDVAPFSRAFWAFPHLLQTADERTGHALDPRPTVEIMLLHQSIDCHTPSHSDSSSQHGSKSASLASCSVCCISSSLSKRICSPERKAEMRTKTWTAERMHEKAR